MRTKPLRQRCCEFQPGVAAVKRRLPRVSVMTFSPTPKVLRPSPPILPAPTQPRLGLCGMGYGFPGVASALLLQPRAEIRNPVWGLRGLEMLFELYTRMTEKKGAKA